MDVVHASVRVSISTIKKQILDVKVPTAGTDSRFFIPQNALETIFTKENILREINATDGHRLGCGEDELVDYIQRSAAKFFAILVFIGQSRRIEAFMKEELSDSDLPIPAKEISSTRINFGTRSTHQKLLGILSKCGVDEFYRLQWSFLAPIFKFRPKVVHYELDNNCILPFIEEDENPADVRHEGGFGTVFRVNIHPAHQRVYDEIDHETTKCNPPYAIKRLNSNNVESFKAEVSMLRRFSGQNHHPHLIRLLATYNFQGNNHLIFPYADDNLRSYWRNKEPPQTASHKLWALKQMEGIASALAMLHEGHAMPTSGTKKYGRHGDIKPDNILWFSDSKRDPNGVLVITDLGLSRVHTVSSRSQIDPASIGYSPAYAPPEIPLKQPVSRAYDIWSLGCLYLEFIIWYIAGQSLLDDFRYTQTKSSNPKEQGFFTILVPEDGSEPWAIVKDSVTRWIQHLRTHPRASEFIWEMLMLIDEGLLVVDPESRLSASAVNQTLCTMVDRAKHDDAFLSPKCSSGMDFSPDLIIDRSLDAQSSQPQALERYSKKFSQGFKTLRSLVSLRSGNRGNVSGVHHHSP